MHWWQGAFTSTSKPPSNDDSLILADGSDGPTTYSVKPGFFSSRRNRLLNRARRLRQVTENDVVEMWRSPDHFQDLSARSALTSTSPQPQPQPLPLPEFCVLLPRDPRFASSSSCSLPLPSPEAVQIPRECNDKERETTEIDGLTRLVGQDSRTYTEHSETLQFRKSQQKQNATQKSSVGCNLKAPISAPASPYPTRGLSPPRSDMWAAQRMAPPGVFQVWPVPEMPHSHSDGNLSLSFSYHMHCEKSAFSVDNSPLHSPRTNTHKPPSPLTTKISSETPLAKCESNAHATVHPLPLPPGVGLSSSLPTSIPSVNSKSEFSGASLPSQSTPISSAGSKPELMPLKFQWQKGKLIGRGTFGSVYVASNRETGALCAMKEVDILPDDSKSAECIRQLEQEIKMLSNLKHPNIVQYYGSEIVGDKFYIYLEYVYPGSINRFIQDHCGAITESVVRSFTRHILSGLAYLHSKKTIHRDIKGANLLVDAYGVVKLADFGMAKHLNGQTANLSLKGSPYWMAPELLQFSMQTDASSDSALAVDVWSLGCTIVEMMDGKPPWSEYEGAAALFKVLKETPPIPETMSADGKDFLQCCFRRNPADRPTASQLLDHPFLTYSHQHDPFPQPLKETKFTFLRHWSRQKSDPLPVPFDTQIKKGKLSNNFSHDSFSSVRVANEAISRHYF